MSEKHDPFEEAIVAIDGAINTLVMARIVLEYAAEGKEPPKGLRLVEGEAESSPEVCRHEWERMPDQSFMCLACGDSRRP